MQSIQDLPFLNPFLSEEYNLEITTKKTKVFGFVGTDHLKLN